MVLERLETDRTGPIVVASDKRHAYVGTTGTKSILVLPLEAAFPAYPTRGLAMFFAGDGTLDDSADRNRLEPHGIVRFVPGRVGQALMFGENGFVSLPWTGYFQAGSHDLSIALFAKFLELDGERMVLDWTNENPPRGIRMWKSEDHRIAFQSLADGTVVKSKLRVATDTWYHIAITQSDREITLYVNGSLEETANGSLRFETVYRPLFLGGAGRGSFRGMLDELAFYNRVLSREEIRSMNAFGQPLVRNERNE